jgi:hypothetical protein
LFFIHLGSRKIHIAGVTPHPNEQWMIQIARNITMEEWGFLAPGQHLIHDRDGKYHIPSDLVVDSYHHTLRAAQPVISRGYPPRGRKTRHKIKPTISIG